MEPPGLAIGGMVPVLEDHLDEETRAMRQKLLRFKLMTRAFY